MDLILRPSDLDPERPWALQIRNHGPADTDYQTIARVSDATAQRLVECGAPYWLFGEPDWEEIEKKRKISAARKVLEDAGVIDRI